MEVKTVSRHSSYPSTRDSGIPWLGQIPTHWAIKRVKHISNVKGRIGFRGYTVEDLVNQGEGALTLGATHIADNGNLDLSAPTFISWKKYYESPEIMVEKNDLLVVQRGSCGKVGYVSEDIGPATINPSLVILKQLKVVPKYLLYSLLSNFNQNWISLLVSSTAVPMLSQEQIGNLILTYPEIDEQRKIVEFLDNQTTKIDALIAKKQRLLALLTEKRTALISQAVTKGLNPNTKKKDSGITWVGAIPAHWETKRLKNIAGINSETLTETTNPNYTIQYLDISNVDELEGISQIQEMQFEDAPSRARRIVRRGDTIISTVRTYLKSVAYLENPPDNLIVSTGFAVLRPKLGIDPKFLCVLVKCNEFVETVVSHSVGVGYPAINPSELSCLPVWVPPLLEQLAIAAYLDRATARIDTLSAKVETAIARLREYRSALISSAVTGKVCVMDEISRQVPGEVEGMKV